MSFDFESAPDDEPMVPVRGLTKRELADALGFTLTKLDKLARDGLPIARRGASRREGLRFNLPEVVAWLCERRAAESGGSDEDTPAVKRRLALAQARRVELENAEKEGELYPVAHFVAWIERSHGEAKERLLRIDSEVTGLTVEQRDQVQAAVRSALEDLSAEAGRRAGLPLPPDDDPAVIAARADDAAHVGNATT